MADGPMIVIEGTREDWPGGARTMTPLDHSRDPNGAFWFGAELDPDGGQVWFRIASDAVRLLKGKTPADRGDRLIDALVGWMTPDRPLRRELSRFDVRVSDGGDTWIELLRW